MYTISQGLSNIKELKQMKAEKTVKSLQTEPLASEKQ